MVRSGSFSAHYGTCTCPAAWQASNSVVWILFVKKISMDLLFFVGTPPLTSGDIYVLAIKVAASLLKVHLKLITIKVPCSLNDT